MKKTTIGLFVALIFCGCIKKQKPLTKEEVLAVIERFDDGWRHKNLRIVDSVLGKSYIYFTQSGFTFSRDSVVQTAGSSTYTLDTMNRNTLDVVLYKNSAVVSTRWYGKGHYKGVPFNEDQRCSITIVKENNRVQIVSEHCTPIRTADLFH